MRTAARDNRARGMTLVEVAVSIALVAVVIVTSIGTRYLAIRHAKRGDAYNTAGRLGQMLLDSWHSVGLPINYDPVTRFAGQLTINGPSGVTGPDIDGAYNTLGSYHVVFDGSRHFYATLGYTDANSDLTNPLACHPAMLHVTVGFLTNCQAGNTSTGANYVRLTTYQ